MPNNKNRMRVIILIIVVLVIALLAISITNKNSTTVSRNNASLDKASGTKSSQQSIEGVNADSPSNTIAKQWQWPRDRDQQERDATPDEDEDESLPFTEQSVYDSLQAVKVDKNGNIILDHDALISLDEALERIHNRLDSESLLKLQDIIRDALPGKTGEQTAQVVEDYQRFLGAQEEFSQMHQGSVSTVQTLNSLDNDQALYRELQNLREIHLGTENTASLFHDSDANAEFMFDSLRLGLEQHLTPEEIESRRREIQQRLQQQLAEETK
ncbi:MAG: hypothetical protein ACJAYF_000975 [Arenicella sp.]|jgi:hypothetical protein